MTRQAFKSAGLPRDAPEAVATEIVIARRHFRMPAVRSWKALRPGKRQARMAKRNGAKPWIARWSATRLSDDRSVRFQIMLYMFR
ncbi:MULTISPECIES: hypothetical protein [Bradyrhizobium]|uniref:hypothetical protein n=1 Tax=Bradyrhizobium TaxID=374 RepID=UPI0011AE5989|nr:MULTISPECIES: hypothetical protein [Bradyrhizobium]